MREAETDRRCRRRIERDADADDTAAELVDGDRQEGPANGEPRHGINDDDVDLGVVHLDDVERASRLGRGTWRWLRGLAAFPFGQHLVRPELVDPRLDGIARRCLEPGDPAATADFLDHGREAGFLRREVKALHGVTDDGFACRFEADFSPAAIRFDRRQHRHAAAGSAPSTEERVDRPRCEPEIVPGFFCRLL